MKNYNLFNKKISSNTYVLLLCCLLLAPSVVSAQLNGFAMGQLNEIKRERANNRVISGDILLGHESSGMAVNHRSTQQSLTNITSLNPLRFCFDDDGYETLAGLVGSYVVLQYKTPKRASFLECTAVNELLDIYPALNYQSQENIELESDSISLQGSSSSGIKFGRLVKATKSRQQFREHLLTLQIGNSGNQFKHFVTTDSDLFDFAIECLKTGAKVRVHYVSKIFNSPQHVEAKLHVWKIESIN